jgi:uncharacterized protein YndB with AHSA1/START domain
MKKKNETTIIADPGKQEIFIIREFDAPRDLVFKATTDPALIVQWLGPRDLTLRIDTYEPRSGGSYRYIHSDAKNNEYGFRGVFHSIVAPERIIQTFEFEGMPGHATLETAKYEELAGGRTKLTVHSVFQSVADRDGMLQSGMERGIVDSHERLDELLEKGI